MSKPPYREQIGAKAYDAPTWALVAFGAGKEYVVRQGMSGTQANDLKHRLEAWQTKVRRLRDDLCLFAHNLYIEQTQGGQSPEDAELVVLERAEQAVSKDLYLLNPWEAGYVCHGVPLGFVTYIVRGT